MSLAHSPVTRPLAVDRRMICRAYPAVNGAADCAGWDGQLHDLLPELQHDCNTGSNGWSTDEIEPNDHLHHRGDGAGNRRRRTDPRPLLRSGHPKAVRHLHIVRQHDLSAPDQDDHRALGLLHPCCGNWPHVRCRGGWARRRQGHAVVRQRLARFTGARPVSGGPVPAWPGRPQGRQRRELGRRRARHDARRLRQARLPGFCGSPVGGQRDPADRRVLDLLRGGLHRHGRARQAAPRRH